MFILTEALVLGSDQSGNWSQPLSFVYKDYIVNLSVYIYAIYHMSFCMYH